MSKYVAVVPYGNEGTMPLNNGSCPLFLANGYEVTCVSSSGDSVCSGFLGHVSDDVVECQESSKKAENEF